jgi:hypothetical protein
MTHDMDTDRMSMRTMRSSIAPQTPEAFTIHAMGVRLRNLAHGSVPRW